jgi:hypothetical protein
MPRGPRGEKRPADVSGVAMCGHANEVCKSVLASSPSRDGTVTLDSFFELDLLKK